MGKWRVFIFWRKTDEIKPYRRGMHLTYRKKTIVLTSSGVYTQGPAIKAPSRTSTRELGSGALEARGAGPAMENRRARGWCDSCVLTVGAAAGGSSCTSADLVRIGPHLPIVIHRPQEKTNRKEGGRPPLPCQASPPQVVRSRPSGVCPEWPRFCRHRESSRRPADFPGVSDRPARRRSDGRGRPPSDRPCTTFHWPRYLGSPGRKFANRQPRHLPDIFPV